MTTQPPPAMEMSDDEKLVLFASLAVGGFAWTMWARTVLQRYSPRCPGWHRGVLLVAPALCLVIMVAGFMRTADPVVRGDFGYLALFAAVGSVTFRLFVGALNFAGLHVTEAAIERHGSAALPVYVGGLLGLAEINIGSSAGSGPTIYTTLGPLLVSILLIHGVLLVAAMTTDIIASVDSDRNTAAGLRFGALLVAASLPISAAAAGDWVSTEATMRDFGAALPWLAGLLAVHWVAHRLAARHSGILLAGFAPGAVFLIIAGFAFR